MRKIPERCFDCKYCSLAGGGYICVIRGCFPWKAYPGAETKDVPVGKQGTGAEQRTS